MIESGLMESAMLRSLLQSSPIGFAFVDADGNYVLVNEAQARIDGVSVEDHIGRHVIEVIPDHAEEALRCHRRVMETGAPVLDVELHGGEGPDGEPSPSWLASYHPVLGDDGTMVGVGATVVDITERTALTGQVQRLAAGVAKDHFREVVDCILDLVVIQRVLRDDNGRIVDFEIEWMNSSPGDVAGRSRDEIIGRRLTDAYPALAGSELIDGYHRVLETGDPYIVPVLPYDDVIDGKHVSGFYSVQVTQLGDGLVTAVRDISELEAARRELEMALHDLDAAQRLAKVGSWRLDPRSGTAQISPQLFRIYGYEPDQVHATPKWIDEHLVHPDDREAANEQARAALERRESFVVEHRLLRADRRVIWVRTSGQPVLDDHGNLIEVWGVTQDITDQLHQRNALAAARARAHAERTSAEELQRALLPASLPDLDGWRIDALYEPAGAHTRVGGDWYDAFTTSADLLTLVVGDVAGHGIASAALMAQARNALRGVAYQDPSPASVLQSLNRVAAVQWPDRFITLLVATIDLRTGTVSHARAGHPPPLIMDGPDLTVLDGGNGPVLGPLGTAAYAQAEAVLEPGQRLVLYTDGLVERRDEAFDQSLDRLNAELSTAWRLPLEDMCRRVVRRMAAARGDHDDDVCLLALERDPVTSTP